MDLFFRYQCAPENFRLAFDWFQIFLFLQKKREPDAWGRLGTRSKARDNSDTDRVRIKPAAGNAVIRNGSTSHHVIYSTFISRITLNYIHY
jgi:hypothetical protein